MTDSEEKVVSFLKWKLLALWKELCEMMVCWGTQVVECFAGADTHAKTHDVQKEY